MFKPKRICMFLFVLCLSATINCFQHKQLQASELTGKRFSCTNSDLAGYGFNTYDFSLQGKFIDENTINASMSMETFYCDRVSETVTAKRNQATGKWEAKNLSFTVAADGYIDDFVYSKSDNSWSVCKATLSRLIISGPALPHLFLLLN